MAVSPDVADSVVHSGASGRSRRAAEGLPVRDNRRRKEGRHSSPARVPSTESAHSGTGAGGAFLRQELSQRTGVVQVSTQRTSCLSGIHFGSRKYFQPISQVASELIWSLLNCVTHFFLDQ